MDARLQEHPESFNDLCFLQIHQRLRALLNPWRTESSQRRCWKNVHIFLWKRCFLNYSQKEPVVITNAAFHFFVSVLSLFTYFAYFCYVIVPFASLVSGRFWPIYWALRIFNFFWLFIVVVILLYDNCDVWAWHARLLSALGCRGRSSSRGKNGWQLTTF